jgi:hypothetical protein
MPASPVSSIPDDAELAFDDAGALIASGVDARTGALLLPPLTVELVSALASGRDLTPEEALEIGRRRGARSAGVGVAAGIDEEELAEAGWGVVFAADDPRVDDYRSALEPLLTLRKAQAGARYAEFAGDRGMQRGEVGWKFLARHGAGPGPVDPTRGMPYYLLLVGEAARLPFEFQCSVDVRHAVGRVDFASLDELSAYATRLVAAEQESPLPGKPRAVFWGTRNPGDLATQRSAKHLITPLARYFTERRGETWQIDSFIAANGSKQALSAAFRQDQPPQLLLTASHGAGYPNGDPLQADWQGALVTQEWPGPLVPGELTTDMQFGAADVTDDMRVDGLVALLFACYGAGTPASDHFLPESVTGTVAIAPSAFSARLPQRLLARGAHAVIGHVERAWTHSFLWQGAGAQQTVFSSLLVRLVNGARVGAAMDFFNGRYAELATMLTDALRDHKAGVPNAEDVALLWTASTDARNYVICGDPAARMRTLK